MISDSTRAFYSSTSSTADPTGHGVLDADGYVRVDDVFDLDVAPDESAALLVERIGEEVRLRVGRQRFGVWFGTSARLTLHRDAGGGRDVLEVVVANDFVGDWIGKHFSKAIAEAVAEVMGRSLQVKYTVAPDAFCDASSGGPPPAPHTPPVIPPVQAVHVPAVVQGKARLRHDLDSFVVGQANEVAYECALSVADHPGGEGAGPAGGRYNPLFIHGNVGLGKTHLLQGICRRFARQHPGKRFAYLTGEEFTNEFLVALRSNRVDAFRRRMRDLDLLCIDDIHFLGGKRATQDEFLHTFNAVEASGRQVVMASDAHPKMIQALSESLINRFVSGMVVRVDTPGKPMRLELVTRLADRHGIAILPDAADWIATRVTQNVRELEGAVTRIAAHVRLANRVADVNLARDVLGDLDRHAGRPMDSTVVFDAACELFGLELRDLLSGRRQRTISLARSFAMYVVRTTTNLSYPEIASRMGKRNHSTVISACRRVEASVRKREVLDWTTPLGDRREEAGELLQRLEDAARAKLATS